VDAVRTQLASLPRRVCCMARYAPVCRDRLGAARAWPARRAGPRYPFPTLTPFIS